MLKGVVSDISAATAAATYVPYTGATTNVDLGAFTFKAGSITGANTSGYQGRFEYDSTNFLNVTVDNTTSGGLATLSTNNGIVAAFQAGASATDYIRFVSQTTGFGPYFLVNSTTTNSPLAFSSKGNANINLNTNGNAQQQVSILHTASAVNQLTLTGGATGTPVNIATAGTDANRSMRFTTAGTGSFSFITGNVAIGTTSTPLSLLHLSRATPPTVFGSPYMNVGRGDFVGTTDKLTIGFGFVTGGNVAPVEIGVQTVNGAGNTKADFVIALRDTTVGTDVPVERVRVTSAGLTGFGQPVPTAQVTVKGSGAGYVNIGQYSPDTSYGGISLTGLINATDYNFVAGHAGQSDQFDLYINRKSGGLITFREAGSAIQMTLNTGGGLAIGSIATAIGRFVSYGSSAVRYVTMKDTPGTLAAPQLYSRQDDNAASSCFGIGNQDITCPVDAGPRMSFILSDNSTTTAINAGIIGVYKERTWTTTTSTQDAYMTFQLALNGTVAEKMRLTSDGYWGLGVAPAWQGHIHGAGQNTSALTDAGSTAGELMIASSLNAVNAGGALSFAFLNDGGTYLRGASIKLLEKTGVTNGRGNLAFSLRSAVADTALTEKMVLTYSGELGIGATVPRAGIHYIGNNSSTQILLSDVDTDATNKNVRIAATAYTTANQPVCVFNYQNTSANNYLSIGGGTSVNNAATIIGFCVGATNNTATGTEVLNITTTRITATIPVQFKSYTVATLPAGANNDRAFVTDALAPAFGAAVVGGGAVRIPVYYDGAWKVG